VVVLPKKGIRVCGEGGFFKRRFNRTKEERKQMQKIEHDFSSVLEKMAKQEKEALKTAVPCVKGLGKVINGEVTALGQNVGSSGASSITGDQRLSDLRAALARLDNLGFRRSAHQVAFHEAFIAACIRQIYGQDFEANKMRICRENEFMDFSAVVGVTCPRRWGKTTALALYSGAFIYTQPGAGICIYSVSKRASNALLQKIVEVVRCLYASNDDKIFIKHNEETVSIHTINGGCGTVFSYPAVPKVRDSFSFSLSLFSFSLASMQVNVWKKKKREWKRRRAWSKRKRSLLSFFLKKRRKKRLSL